MGQLCLSLQGVVVEDDWEGGEWWKERKKERRRESDGRDVGFVAQKENEVGVAKEVKVAIKSSKDLENVPLPEVDVVSGARIKVNEQMGTLDYNI